MSTYVGVYDKIGENLKKGENAMSQTANIRVNRAIRPTYPDWVKEVLHPELENSGPAEYDVGQLEQ